jgi:L-iditol 2-dehydrogenase
MKAARMHKIGDFRTDTLDIPKIQGEQLLMKVGACGICGSDIPRIYELGTSNQKYHLTLGHEFAGEIVAVGDKADSSLIGTKAAVFPLIPCGTCDSCESGDYAKCYNYDYLGSRRDGGFAEYCVIPSKWHLVPSSNPRTSFGAMSMVEPATVAQHAVRKGRVTGGSVVVIFGAGPIGIMAARWCEIFGAFKVILFDVLDEKVKFSQSRGLALTYNVLTEDAVSLVKHHNRGRLADVVIEGTGTGAALNLAIDCIKPNGTVVMLGNPHKDTVLSLKSHSNILRKELEFRGVWNSNYSNNPVNEWQYTMDMLDKGIFQCEDLITHKTDLTGLPELCRQIYKREISICKAVCCNLP